MRYVNASEQLLIMSNSDYSLNPPHFQRFIYFEAQVFTQPKTIVTLCSQGHNWSVDFTPNKGCFFLVFFNSTLTEIRHVVKSLIPPFLLVDVINYLSIQARSAVTAVCVSAIA